MTPFTHLIGRKPFIIGTADDPYLRRWWIIPRNKFFNIYVHHFLRSDDDRALHDHPWWNVSILLCGRYWEIMPDQAKLRISPSIIFRKAEAAHRIDLVANKPVWTLFITGPKVREWGFLCPQGWRHWQVFTSNDGKEVGRGCG